MPVTDVSFMPPTHTHTRPGRRSIHPWIGTRWVCLAPVQPHVQLFLAESSEISATSPHQTPRPRSARPDAPPPICQAEHAVPFAL